VGPAARAHLGNEELGLGLAVASLPPVVLLGLVLEHSELRGGAGRGEWPVRGGCGRDGGNGRGAPAERPWGRRPRRSLEERSLARGVATGCRAQGVAGQGPQGRARGYQQPPTQGGSGKRRGRAAHLGALKVLEDLGGDLRTLHVRHTDLHVVPVLRQGEWRRPFQLLVGVVAGRGDHTAAFGGACGRCIADIPAAEGLSHLEREHAVELDARAGLDVQAVGGVVPARPPGRGGAGQCGSCGEDEGTGRRPRRR